MSTVSEQMERMRQSLSLAHGAALRLQRLLSLPFDQDGRPSMFRIPLARQVLAQALRDAADRCEEVGVHQDDTRWTAPVALLHRAGGFVWTVTQPKTCVVIATLLESLRVKVDVLRDRSKHAADIKLTLH